MTRVIATLENSASSKRRTVTSTKPLSRVACRMSVSEVQSSRTLAGIGEVAERLKAAVC
jgi:hypothetical protein